MRKGARPRITPPEGGWTVTALHAALAARYPSPEYALLTEVRSHTGFAPLGAATRTADALALGLWGSRGRDLHGFEIKISRGDWLREKAAPEKAEAIAQFCDHWWVVAADAAVVADGELPESWGLLVPRGGRLVAVKEAGALQPKPITRAFLGALLRRVTETTLPAGEIEARVQAKLDVERKRLEALQGHQLTREKQRADAAEETIRRFEDAACVRITAWNAGPVGHVVAAVQSGHSAQMVAALRNAVRDAEVATAAWRRAFAELAALVPSPAVVRVIAAHPDVPLRVLVDHSGPTPTLPHLEVDGKERPDDAARRLVARCGGPCAPLRPLGGHRVDDLAAHLFVTRTGPAWSPPAPYAWGHVMALLTDRAVSLRDVDLLSLYRGRLETGRLAVDAVNAPEAPAVPVP